MSDRRPDPKPTPPHPRAFPLADTLLALGCAALALWVHRGALGVYFHPDDLISLERARGIIPTPDLGPWRLLAGKLFFAASIRAFGTNAHAYHVVNAVVHAANVILLYALVRRWGGTSLAATVTAGLFGAARPAFSVLQQAVGIGELLAFGFAAAAMLLCERRTLAPRLAAALLFLAALLSKEGVLLLPLVLLLPREPGTWRQREAWRTRVGVAWPLLAVSALVGAALGFGNVVPRAFGGEAYATAFGMNLFHNLMTYLAWACDLWNPFYDQPGGVSREAWQYGIPVLGALTALAWEARHRTRLPALGLAWMGLGLAPVLPLLHHTYANYLYTPIAGLVVALGAGLEALLPAYAAVEPRRGGGRPRHGAPVPRTRVIAWAAAVVIVAGHAATSARLLEARAAKRFQGLDLPFDPQLRKSDMVRRAAAGLQQSSPVPPRRIVLIMPPEFLGRVDGRTGSVRGDTAMTVDQTLMYRVLDGGRALRALFPGLDSVAFVPRWSAAYADFDLCANTFEGDIVDFGRGPEALLRLGEVLGQGPYPAIAVDLLTRASAAYPQDPRLRQALVTALAKQTPR